MHAFLPLFLLLAAAPPTAAPPDGPAAGWIQLFDGRSLFGWTATTAETWSAAGGVLKAAKGHSGWLRTQASFGDFRLKLEYRVTNPDAASGIGLRMGAAGPGYEIAIQDTHEKFPTGSIAGRAKARAPKPAAGEWRSLDVTARGANLTVRLDQRQVASVKHFGPLHGPIGLRFVEGNPIEFRNVRLKPLDMACLFNGEDLAGWRPQGNAHWSVEDRAVRGEGGPGWLETERAWDDFVLQVDVRAAGSGGPAGLFFRASRGFSRSGYESALSATPGTLPGMQDARPAPERAGDWFTKTIAVRDRHISVWVDGVPVTHWDDPRPAGLDPQQGSARLQRGVLSLHLHEPGSTAAFKDLCIAPLVRR